ncbi:hypothetical protein H312_03060 [Anncaliia algerae PRA339]|uniref:Uncharacterized protein n=1 Tax=Anncaliia algerae PRA339 TaxID=1288291 RepID=A0A059EXV7_9MICR|nr:hypothetical protein H312_03060 [Anncaliia algerae PRA339]
MNKNRIIPPIKLFSNDLHKITKKDDEYFLKERKVNKIELCGFLYDITPNNFKLVDFYGEINCDSRIELFKPDSYVILCYIINDKLTCVSAKNVGYYEEIFFWIEAVKYSKYIQ